MREIEILADKVIYTRVKNVRDKVNAGLVDRLLNEGYDIEDIFIKTELVKDSDCGCTKQIKVIAYVDE